MKLVSNTGRRLATGMPCGRRGSISRRAAAGRAVRPHEGIDNHFTVMLPGHRRPASSCIRSVSTGRSSKPAISSFVDYEAYDRGRSEAETPLFHIHSAHPQGPRAARRLVLHPHMPLATALHDGRGGRLEPRTRSAAASRRTSLWTTPSMVWCSMSTEAIGWRVPGGKAVLSAVIMASSDGRTVAEAFDDLYFLERACQCRSWPCRPGRPAAEVKDEVAKATSATATWGPYAHNIFGAEALLDRGRTGLRELAAGHHSPGGGPSSGTQPAVQTSSAGYRRLAVGRK